MAPRPPGITSCILEVERKFRSLAVRKLTQHGGTPAFKSLRQLPTQSLHDVYYDQSGRLSSAGAWVRKRNGEWEAKIKKGGNFTNSRFEELRDTGDIAAHVKRIVGTDVSVDASSSFGLSPIATLSTTRETWIADDEFSIVLDKTDIGHEVGEVELQRVVAGVDGSGPSEGQKESITRELDERISAFMKRYSWAFSPGEPKGKLTAYFEKMSSKG